MGAKNIWKTLDPPKCRICGEDIPRLHDQAYRDWQARKVCPRSTDKKEVSCYTIDRQNIGRGKNNIAGHQKKKIIAPAPSKPKKHVSPEEIARLDAEQTRINIECHKRDMERCGYIGTPGRILSRAEIDSVAHLYSPPTGSINKDYNPHYRNKLSRRGMEI